MLDRAAGMGDLIRAHRGIADERELVVVAEFVEQLRGRRTLGEAALVVLPHALVRAVVEIEEFEVLELARRGREQFLAELDERVHRAADRSEEHTSELQSLMRISYAVFCLKKKKTHDQR